MIEINGNFREDSIVKKFEEINWQFITASRLFINTGLDYINNFFPASEQTTKVKG